MTCADGAEDLDARDLMQILCQACKFLSKEQLFSIKIESGKDLSMYCEGYNENLLDLYLDHLYFDLNFNSNQDKINKFVSEGIRLGAFILEKK